MKESRPENSGCAVVTIGHSTRTVEEFIHLLQTYDVKQVIDVRTVPRSRHCPQFNRENFPHDLRSAGIDYLHMPGLGGLRHPRKDSTNKGWQNASFRGYADYMETPAFERDIDALVNLIRHRRIALMCAEALPWRCHRSLIADALEVRGLKVCHILSPTQLRPHRVTSFAEVKEGRLGYPAPKS
jgi:uncharacterized protein (DUF488 family)